ncbi:MAG: hypothetical protein NG740_06335 [Omnitrophica bacterium]|nr:hypothetical protein [Candidatus Omnitrophota bacterium]
MPTNSSPEDRLLRLIKGKYKGRAEAVGNSRAARKESLLTDVSKKILLENKALRPLFSDSVNKIFVFVLIGLVAYLAYNLLFPPIDLDSIIGESRPAQDPARAVKVEGAGVSPRIEDYAVYAKMLRNRKLFSAPVVEKENLAREPEIDISGRFNLVGIIAGDDPQAIIEDKEAKKTHYLYAGQSFSGVTVREVTEGKVVLEYNGKEIMLIL